MPIEIQQSLGILSIDVRWDTLQFFRSQSLVWGKCGGKYLRLATWAEVDRKNRLWTIPADHMKRGEAHIVPLCDEALSVLAKAEAFRREGTKVVFPGATGKPLSDMALLNVLRDMRP